MPSPEQPLTYTTVEKAVTNGAAAFRLTLRLEAVTPKVFPPTYEKGKYATEVRKIGGREVPCVLLDSVPSQANRMELALQEVVDAKVIKLPLIETLFASDGHSRVRRVTSLQAPHRIADAILRDSYLGGVRFRQSDVGGELDRLSLGYATPLLRHAPHCLLFGMWDSTGPRGGMGVKFPRAVVSEIVGVGAVGGVKTSSRIDPLGIRTAAGPLYKAKDGWTLDKTDAETDAKNLPVKLGKDGKGNPSDANHGNIPPSLSEGGFTIDYAEQVTVVSLPALRRLRFPATPTGSSTSAADASAQTYLASLALLAVTLAVDSGYDLRSRCILRATDPVRWQLLGKPGDPDQTFGLSRTQAVALYETALANVREAGLNVTTEAVQLTASPDLETLIKRSEELIVTSAETGDQ